MYSITFDGTTLTGYKDGNLAGSGTPPLQNTFDDSVHVGGPSFWAVQFAGGFDEFTVWDVALGQGAITGLYNNNVIPEPATLMLLLMTGVAVVLYRR